MNRLPSYSLFHGRRGRHPSLPFCCPPDRRYTSPSPDYEAQVLSFSAGFISVPPRIEVYNGKPYTVDDVSTCRLDESGLGATKVDSEDSHVNGHHSDMLLNITRGIPCRPGFNWVEHGFWVVNHIDDGVGFVKVYEFGDLVFEICLPSGLQKYAFQ